jgi:hypothetical protein
MPIMKPVQEPILGFGVSGAGVQDATAAAAPILQASQTLEQRGINAKKAQEAANYQKLLRTGAEGMRAYAVEVSGIHPELGQQLAQEAEQYATFFSDPALTGDKAEQYASHFYESANNRIKHADESAKKAKEEQQKTDKFKRFQSEFIPSVSGLVEQAKQKPEMQSDIAMKLGASEFAGEKYAADFMNDLKAARPPMDMSKFNAGREDKTFDQEKSLRDKWETSTKDFRDVRDAFGRIKVSAKDPSPSGDLALIFNYMKMLDPGSTVREGEFATAQNSGSAWEILGAKYNKVMEGERLTPSQRADFVARARNLYKQQESQAKKSGEETRRLAKLYKLDPERVVLDQGLFDDEPEPPVKTKGVTLGKGQKKDFGGGVSVERVD